MKRKNEAAVNLKTGRFNNIDTAVIISSVSKAVQNCNRRQRGDVVWSVVFYKYKTNSFVLPCIHC